MELIPTADEGLVQVSVNFRAGTTLEKQNQVMTEWERIAEEHEDVQGYSVSIGSSSALSAGGATLTASLKQDRKMSTMEVVDQWNELAQKMTNVDVTVASSGSSMSALMSAGSYEIDLQSHDIALLRQEAERLTTAIRDVEGVVKAAHSFANPTTLVKVDVDPLKAMQYGLTPIQVAMELHNVLSGMNPINLTKDGSEYEVWLEYPEGQYDDLNKIMDWMISTSFGVSVPLRDIAELVYTEGQESIEKQDGIYYVAVTATTNSELRFEAQDAIDELVANMEFADGVSPTSSMYTDMMLEELYSILKAILTAVFLVFLVMAMQFESPRFSIMVMTCIPFALIGSFFLLAVTNSSISMVSLMGFLMLMGIVVNNGILFVDSVNQFRLEMSLEDALIQSGVIRLRPILMTTLTTILSMVPLGLGIGTNAVMMQGMALVIIGGLIASTVLTLILIPSFYLILDKKKIA
jgi:HAE1 family hydrophobic/amphiphilic exporter-1